MTASESSTGSGLPRRRLLQAGAVGLLGGTVLHANTATARPYDRVTRGGAAHTVSLNSDWRFGGPFTPGATEPDFDDSDYPRITLPHTVADLSWRRWDPADWERRWIYRRRLDLPRELQRMRLFLDFGGAITGATVVLNGRQLGRHDGGYLPFSYELTGRMRDKDNVVAVDLDSRFDINVPPNRPGEPTTTVDFWQPGGLYRDVTLRAVPQVFLADVFAKPVDVLDSGRRVDVECTVDAAVALDRSARVEVELYDDGHRIARDSTALTVDDPGRSVVRLRLDRLGDIALWDVDDPKMYDVVATLYLGDEAVHDYVTRIGLRDARFTRDGFYLNGDRLQLFGVNRHQFYPYAGASMPARVQRRDAEIMRRDLNCNMVRCSHYPQAESFFDACDEVGLLAFEEVAGWGLYLGDERWKELVVRDVRDMVVRDRNHPSIVVWGARLNETEDDVELFTRTRDLAHRLDDSRQTTGSMIGPLYGSKNFVQDVFSFNDYTVADGHASLQEPRDDFPYLVSEAVGTLSGPARYYRRTDPVADQQGQAVAHARVHQIAATDKRYCGLLSWSGFDYPSGNGNNFEGVKYTGVVDLFREPKLGAAIYQSQVAPSVRPVIQPAFYWDFGPDSPADGPGAEAMICSNCERLEVFVGGEPFIEAGPDRERFGRLAYPPTFVDLTVDSRQRPELRIDGYVGDERVLSRSFSADPGHDSLEVRADDSRLRADGVDATRVVFRAVDRYGAPRPYPGGEVALSVAGAGQLVGDNPFAFADTGGVGAVWIRSVNDHAGTVRIRASHPALGEGTVSIETHPVPPAGEPAANAELALETVPTLVRPGESSDVTATLSNHSHPVLRGVEIDLPAPPGWRRRPLTPTAFETVRPGQSVRSTWRVSAPDQTDSGPRRLTATAAYLGSGQEDANRAGSELVVPTTVRAARQNAGASPDSDVRSADFDGVANSYSRDALAEQGLAPGARVTHDGVVFDWPNVPVGAPDNVLCDGQTIELSGSGSRIGVVGAASRGPLTGAVTVHYADGSASEAVLTLDDWFFPPRSGNEVIAAMSYLNAANSKADNGEAGRRTHDVYVFYADVAVQQGKTVAGLTLPRIGSTVEGGRPAMHVFALALG